MGLALHDVFPELDLEEENGAGVGKLSYPRPISEPPSPTSSRATTPLPSDQSDDEEEEEERGRDARDDIDEVEEVCQLDEIIESNDTDVVLEDDVVVEDVVVVEEVESADADVVQTMVSGSGTVSEVKNPFTLTEPAQEVVAEAGSEHRPTGRP